jgi:hypothetical protein
MTSTATTRPDSGGSILAPVVGEMDEGRTAGATAGLGMLLTAGGGGKGAPAAGGGMGFPVSVRGCNFSLGGCGVEDSLETLPAGLPGGGGGVGASLLIRDIGR